jgi:hypothetical protein
MVAEVSGRDNLVNRLSQRFEGQPPAVALLKDQGKIKAGEGVYNMPPT